MTHQERITERRSVPRNVGCEVAHACSGGQRFSPGEHDERGVRVIGRTRVYRFRNLCMVALFSTPDIPRCH